MIGRLWRLLGRGTAQGLPAEVPFDTALRPAEPVYAVGDIHGRADLLGYLLQRLDADMTARGHQRARVVFLGDYVDRGDQSAQVLADLVRLGETLGDCVVFLMGNHERMMLEFLENPEAAGPRWLHNGGLQTLASYRIGGVSERMSDPDLAAAALALAAALPRGTEAWIRGLPLIWRSGNLACVHAAADPARSLDDQDERTLIWGHPDFLRKARTDGIWVAHGHTIVDQPSAAAGRIAVDTGACFTGRLTAAAIYPDQPVRFL